MTKGDYSIEDFFNICKESTYIITITTVLFIGSGTGYTLYVHVRHDEIINYEYLASFRSLSQVRAQ